MRVLLVEDDKAIASFVIKGLSEDGYEVDHASDGESGLRLALTEPYDVAIIDIMLPGLDGLSLISRIRSEKKTTPVLIMSARSSDEDRLKGFEAGGDDYLPKPFAFSELLSRIHALIWRTKNLPETDRLTVADLTVDLVLMEASRAGRVIDLQPLEFALLEYLIRNAGRIVSKRMIMEHVWNYSFVPQTNIVETRVGRLRDKVDRGFDKQLIHTVPGAGYIIAERS